jgi:hypothetical protein
MHGFKSGTTWNADSTTALETAPQGLFDAYAIEAETSGH